MCFTPVISLSTAIIEWMLAIVMLLTFRKSKLTPYFAVLFFFLGWYQFTEYMLCSTGNLIWINLGFIGYSFLPAIGLHSVMSYFKIKKNLFLIYSIPGMFSLLALFRTDFALFGQCMTFFVKAITILTFNLILWVPYGLYYAVFIAASFLILFDAYRKAKTKLERKIDMAEMLGILFMTIPTFILVVIFPSLNIMFPSVLCHFALLLAILFFASVYWDEKKSLHEAYHKP